MVSSFLPFLRHCEERSDVAISWWIKWPFESRHD